MKFYIVIADVNGTVLKSRFRTSDQAFARASSYRAQGHKTIIKVVENGEILNWYSGNIVKWLLLDLAQIAFTIIWSITVPDNCQSCPTYEELDLIYPDNTHPGVSGEIIDNVREPPSMVNQWKYYEQQEYDYLIFYDPPPEIVFRSYHITIQPSIPTYKLNQGISNNLNFTESNNVIFGSDRWVGNNCGSASISAKVWASLLGDTMGYMKSGCDGTQTIFNHNATYSYSSNDEESKSFEWGLSSDGQQTTNASTGGKLTKQDNVFQWQLDLQNYIQKWLDSMIN